MSIVLPWRNWYHCIGNTYGTWLPGDRRGWRERHHREHVQGDYKHPPIESSDALYEYMRNQMKRAVVVFPREARLAACVALVESLQHHNVEVVDLCVGAVHIHALARFTPWIDSNTVIENMQTPPTGVGGLSQGGLTGECAGAKRGAVVIDAQPRLVMGKAKSWCTRKLKQHGFFSQRRGGLWAQRIKCEPVRDRGHQISVAGYIRRHADDGAAVWSLIRKPTIS